jgi:hypothetical protein
MSSLGKKWDDGNGGGGGGNARRKGANGPRGSTKRRPQQQQPVPRSPLLSPVAAVPARPWPNEAHHSFQIMF